MKLFSEKMSPTGTINLDAIQKLFTITELDDISVFVRETAQNSWDARKDKNSKLDIDLDYKVGKISPDLQKSFDKTFFADATAEIKNKIQRYTREGQTYLIVQDKGTVGLAGPTLATEKGIRNNYVAFLLNIGQEHNDASSGGAFGFGKSVFFRASTPKTILIYTRTRNAEEKLESRFIGVTLHKTPGDTAHTGRHWWCEPGVANGQAIPRPIIGSEADKLGELLGIKAYTGDETGTSIAVIGPEFDNLKRIGQNHPDSKQLADCIAEAANFWYWPRMEGGGAQDGKLRCKVWHENSQVIPFDYAETAPFKAYKDCLAVIQKAVAAGGNSGLTNNPFQQFHEIKYQYKRVGYLCLTKYLRTDRQPFKSRILDPDSGAVMSHPLGTILWKTMNEEATNRHVALIRSPGQVIQYLRLPECSDNMMEYAAVFFLHPEGANGGELLQYFTKSEPAAHDRWESNNNAGPVANTLNKIKELVRDFARPESQGASSSASGLGNVSSSLASLWSSGEGSGGLRGRRGGGGGGGGGATSKIKVKPGKLFAIEGVNYVSIQFSAPDLEGWSATVKATVKSVLYGGGNDDIDEGEEGSPRLVGWFDQEPSTGTLKEIRARAMSTSPAFTIAQAYEGQTLCALFLAPSKYWAEFNILSTNG
jgi:hypothetical protein